MTCRVDWIKKKKKDEKFVTVSVTFRMDSIFHRVWSIGLNEKVLFHDQYTDHCDGQ